MRDVQKTIDQAAALGSKKRLLLGEICELRNRSMKQGEVNTWNLIMDTFDFGFVLGYRLGAKEKRQLAGKG